MTIVAGLVGFVIGIALGASGLWMLANVPIGPIDGRVAAGAALAILLSVTVIVLRRSRHRVAFGAGAGAGLVATGSLLGYLLYEPPPSDRAMMENLARHEADFDRIRAMLQADPELSQVNADLFPLQRRKDPDLPPERIAAYRRLLHAAGIFSALSNGPRDFSDGPPETSFVAWERYLTIDGVDTADAK